MTQQFFYDQSIRRWILQIMRLFSGFTVQYGLDNAGSQLYSTVPVVWGDSTFSAAAITRLNSENVMPNFPLISVYIQNLKYDRSRVQAPTYTDVKSVRTRKWDAALGTYLPQQANAYTLKRFMPVPFNLEIKVDIVTSNTQQKLQILEQILPLYNPALEIQKTDDYLDWESLSFLELTDVNWTNRTIPTGQGSDSSFDVCTLQFMSPIFLSLPAQVSKMGVIFKVINNIEQLGSLNDLVTMTRQVVTYQNYGLWVQDGKIFILNQNVNTINGPVNATLYGTPQEWPGIISAYGNIRAGVSQIGLSYDGSANEILGTITPDPANSVIMLYSVDSSTLPANTLPAINAIVDPLAIAPNYGLPVAEPGQSYLLTNPVGPVNADNLGTYITQAPTGNIDGTNNVFTVSFDIADANSLIVTLNGQVLNDELDYSVLGNAITLTVPPATGEWLFVYYLNNLEGDETVFVNVNPGGPMDSTNKAFGLPVLPTPASSLNVFYNGTLLVEGIGNDYICNGLTITLSFAPSATDSLVAIYRITEVTHSNIDYADGEIPYGTADGTNRSFTLQYTPIGLYLYYDGILLSQGSDYDLIGNTITYAFAPTSGDSQAAFYAYNPNGVGAWPYNAPNSEAQANVNDIITYSGTAWVTTFDAAANTGNVQFVWNDATNQQYQWNGNAWVAGWEGPYNAANWRMII